MPVAFAVDHFEALILAALLSEKRRELRALWTQVVGAAAFDVSTHETPEAAAATYADRIEACLSWYERRFQSAIDELVEVGFEWDEFQRALPPNTAEYGQLDRLVNGVLGMLQVDARLEYKRRRNLEIAEEIEALRDLIASRCSAYDDKRFGDILASAVERGSVSDYAACYEELSRLAALDASYQRYRVLLSHLEPCAPDWAAAVARGTEPSRSYAGAEEAYLWKQFDQELAERSEKSIPALQREIEVLSKRFRRITSDVAERLAWNGICGRTNDAQQAALTRYLLAIKQFGAGKGILAGKFAALAQTEMEASQGAVPVWVMPLNRVYDTYRTPGAFDVVILDEASQADIYALLVTCLGKEIIVVGDDQQVTPERPGVELAQVAQLIENSLQGIPGKDLFIEESSIFDFARTAFGTPVRLTEHFRCLEPIIRFSNNLSYNGDIKPLRDGSEVAIRPATVAVSVPTGIAANDANEEEAKVLASLLCAMIEQSEYKNATFGVIALRGTKQALVVEQILRRYLEPRVIDERRIRCGSPPQFQGDERDVMLLSVIDSPNENGRVTNRHTGPRDQTKKRYNVAASRARDQMWVCYSMDPNRLDPTDLRRRLILHAANPDGTEIRKQAASERAESEFEKLVQARLIDAGYCVLPQHRVGSYRIDMLVTDGVRSLAVECDGDRYHTQDTLAADVARQMILERCGYRFERIRGTAFFRNPEKAMQPTLDRLQRMGMLGAKPDERPADTDGEAILTRVQARAAELREEWHASEAEPSGYEAPGKRRGWARRVAKSPSNPTLSMEPMLDNAGDSLGFDLVDTEARQAVQTFGAAEPSPRNLEGDAIITRLQGRGIEVVDKRSLGGALWMVGGPELDDLAAELALQGYVFHYTDGGSRATRQRSAWYLRRT
jgi:very-short-patch-repair endonuclease/superfamily I DNA/RNA helicase